MSITDALEALAEAFAERVASLVVERLRQEPGPATPRGYPVQDPVPEYVDTKQAAALLGISRKGLEGLRARGLGPPFLRIGKAVRYRVSDLHVQPDRAGTGKRHAR